MLCLVVDKEEREAEEVGRIVGARLRRVARSKGLTAGQVHYMTEALAPGAVSSATVSALLRGAIGNPGIGTVMAVARALGLTLAEATGEGPLPDPVTPPPLADESEAAARLSSLEEHVAALNDRLALVLDHMPALVESRRPADKRRRPA